MIYKNRKAIVWSEIGWWVIALAVLALVIVALIILKQRGINIIEEIKQIFRFGR